MKVVEMQQGTEFYLSVESNYFDNKDAKGQDDVILFEMGQYPDGKHEIDSIVIVSIADARQFAHDILELCDQIEAEGEKE